MDRERMLTERQWEKETDREKEREKKRKKEENREKKRHIEKIREAENQVNWKTERLKGRQTKRPRYIETERKETEIWKDMGESNTGMQRQRKNRERKRQRYGKIWEKATEVWRDREKNRERERKRQKRVTDKKRQIDNWHYGNTLKTLLIMILLLRLINGTCFFIYCYK
jgi:hypothetical protein